MSIENNNIENNSTKIYLVMYAYYSDWHIYGYFTNRDDAEKYCIEHKEQDLYVKEVDSYNEETGNFREIKPKYEFGILFRKCVNDAKVVEYLRDDSCFSWESGSYGYYDEPFLRSNHLDYRDYDWVRVYVNLDSRDIERAKKIAQDILYQYLGMFDNKLSRKNVSEFNKILAKDEIERKKAIEAEKLKKRELAELKRLKEKYGDSW